MAYEIAPGVTGVEPGAVDGATESQSDILDIVTAQLGTIIHSLGLIKDILEGSKSPGPIP